MKNRRIAVQILGPLGDVINTSGLFKRLREKYPDAILSIITIKRGEQATFGIKELDERYIFDEVLEKHKLLETIKFGLSIRGKFDTIIVLDNSLRSAICAFMTGAKERIGRGRELRELFLTYVIPYTKKERNDEIHVSQHFARCLRPLNINIKNVGTYFEISEDNKNTVSELLIKNGIKDDENLIGFCPACHAESKSMMIEDVVEVIKKINTNLGCKVVLIGGNDITEFVSQLKTYQNLDYLDFTGKTKFCETAALINRCEKFISVDTSCMHLAFARKVPTVSVFFSKLFKKWGPYDLKNNSLYLNLDSRKVDTDEIVEKLKKLPQM